MLFLAQATFPLHRKTPTELEIGHHNHFQLTQGKKKLQKSQMTVQILCLYFPDHFSLDCRWDPTHWRLEMFPLHYDSFLKVTTEEAALLHFDAKPTHLNLVPHRHCTLKYHCWLPRRPEVNKQVPLMHTPHLGRVLSLSWFPLELRHNIRNLSGEVKSGFQLDKMFPLLEGWIHCSMFFNMMVGSQRWGGLVAHLLSFWHTRTHQTRCRPTVCRSNEEMSEQ